MVTGKQSPLLEVGMAVTELITLGGKGQQG